MTWMASSSQWRVSLSGGRGFTVDGRGEGGRRKSVHTSARELSVITQEPVPAPFPVTHEPGSAPSLSLTEG